MSEIFQAKIHFLTHSQTKILHTWSAFFHRFVYRPFLSISVHYSWFFSLAFSFHKTKQIDSNVPARVAMVRESALERPAKFSNAHGASVFCDNAVGSESARLSFEHTARGAFVKREKTTTGTKHSKPRLDKAPVNANIVLCAEWRILLESRRSIHHWLVTLRHSEIKILNISRRFFWKIYSKLNLKKI